MDKTESFDTSQAPAGMQFVFVDVTYQSGDNQNIDQTLFFEPARLKDSAGYVYEAQANLRKPELSDSSGVIPRGGKVRGWRTFQLPKTASGLLLDFPLNQGFGLDNPLRLMVKLDATATATPPSSLGQPVGRVGKGHQLVGQGAYLMQVNNTVVTDQLPASLGLQKADPGKKWVEVELIFESKAERGMQVNLNNATLRDSDNFIYKTDSNLYYQPALPVISDLPKGYKTQGWIGFEVPATAKDFVLVYQRDSRESVNLEVALDG